jgi:hypothetical membrane protein
MTITPDPRTGTGRTGACDPATRVTRSLLAYGVVAGPVYVGVSLAQAFTRDGFDVSRHAWSLLANGPFGWIQVANLAFTGLATIAFAVGLRRALHPGRGARWAPRLVAGYGAGMLAAAVFRADPAFGFPAGTPDGPGAVTWHGMLHLTCAGIGFLCLVAACFVVAGRYAAEGRRGWAAYSRITGVAFLAGFAGVTTGLPALNLAFVAAVIAAWTWVAAVAVDRYRTAAP